MPSGAGKATCRSDSGLVAAGISRCLTAQVTGLGAGALGAESCFL
jgi:hypothetical protein